MNTRMSTLSDAKAALLAMTKEAAELKNAVGGSITEAVADWLAPHYALAAREQLATAKGAERLRILRAFVQDWALLRRGDQYAERLKIEREQLELDREQSKERTEKSFLEWAQKPENKARICSGNLSAEEKAERTRRIFGAPRGGLSREALAAIEKEAKLLS